MSEEIEQFGNRLSEVARAWRNAMDRRLKQTDLTHARWLPLYFLSKAPDGLSQVDLSNLIGVHASALVRQLDILEQRGLIERVRSSTDRRTHIVRLTTAGQEAVEMIRAEVVALRGRCLGGLETQELRRFIDLMDEIIKRANMVT